jgi:hypothetical protein
MASGSKRSSLSMIPLQKKSKHTTLLTILGNSATFSPNLLNGVNKILQNDESFQRAFE